MSESFRSSTFSGRITAVTGKPSHGIVLILSVTALVYGLSLANAFVWDDWILQVGNPVYERFDLRGILFGKANGVEYLPVRDLTLALDAWIWGMRPFGFHLTNLLLYLACLAALYSMVARIADLTKREDGAAVAFWTTLLFALHPLHVEPIALIAARNTVLAGLFLFLSVALLLRGLLDRRNLPVGIALLCFVLAVFSKAVAVFLPVFLIVLLFFVPAALAPLPKKSVVLLLFTAVAAAAAWVHSVNAAETGVVNDEVLRYGASSRWLALAKALQIPFFYIGKIVVPWPLSVDYSITFLSGAMLVRAVLAALGLAAVITIAWMARKRSPLVTLGVAWFLISLGPVLNLFPTYPVVADRYAFFSIAGFGLACAAALALPLFRRKAMVLPLIGVLALWAGMSVFRIMDWRSDIALWESAIAVDPAAPRTNLGLALWDEGRFEEALAQLAVDKQKRGTHYYSLYTGRFLLMNGRTKDAINAFRQSMAEGGDAWKETHLYLAQALERNGEALASLEQYLKVLDTVSVDPGGRYDQGAREGVARMRVLFEPRLEALRRSAEARPTDINAQGELAQLLYAIGRYDDAERQYRRALEIDPARWDAWYNLGLTHMRRKQYAAAVPLFEKALTLQGGDRTILNNLGICQMHLKHYREAEQAYRGALERDPAFFFAAFNLGRLYFLTGDAPRARSTFQNARALASGDPALQSRIDLYLGQLQ